MSISAKNTLTHDYYLVLAYLYFASMQLLSGIFISQNKFRLGSGFYKFHGCYYANILTLVKPTCLTKSTFLQRLCELSELNWKTFFGRILLKVHCYFVRHQSCKNDFFCKLWTKFMKFTLINAHINDEKELLPIRWCVQPIWWFFLSKSYY